MRKLNLFLTLVALSLATSSIWATPSVAVDGKLPCQFSVSATKKVQFSQGNLQAVFASAGTSTCIWKFADEQYQYIGNASANNAVGNNQVTTAGTVDLFGWVGESSALAAYGINNSTSGYGNSKTENLKSDWGTLPIWNGGNVENSGWRTLTYEEWRYLLNRNGDKASEVNGNAGISYAKAVVNGVTGLILFPDGSIFPSFDFLGEVRLGISYEATQNSCTLEQWEELERNGCVFLPAAGHRSGTTVEQAGELGLYWSSTPHPDDKGYARNMGCSNTSVDKEGLYYAGYGRNRGRSVRLVKDATGEARVFTASVINPPTANSRTFDNSTQKIFFEGTALGGTMMYSIDGGSTWSAYSSSNVNAGEFIVHYKIEGSGCFNDFTPDPDTIHVTIKRKSAGVSAPSPMPTIAAATSLTYNGSAQNSVTNTGSIQSGYTTVYSTDGVNWSTTIPQGTDAGDYTVYYKFYKGTNEEYVPSPNTINATIAKADLSVDLPASTNSIPYDGTEKTLLEIDPVADCVIWYKLGDGDWTTTPPTGTDAGDYSVQYKIVPDDEVNYNTIGPNTVTVTILDYPTVYDNADPTTKLTELLNTPSDLKVKRTIYADDEYNTICLPFALDESALAASPLAGFNRLKTFKGAQVTGTAPDLYIDIFVEDATTIEAGVPYLITYPSAHADIVNPVFTGITVTTTEPSAVSVDGITFQGMFAQVHIDPYDAGHTQDYLFVGANSQLYWPLSTQTSSDIKMRGFRAYFIIDRNSITPALAPKGTRARIMDAPKTTTAIDNPSAKFGGSEKIIENGILYIIRNGVKYNAQGQIVK